MGDFRYVISNWNLEYRHTVGSAGSRFLDGLTKGVVIAARCNRCGRVDVPPQSFCDFCFSDDVTFVEVGPEGLVEAATVVTEGFEGSPPVPYILGLVLLDGATSSLINFVRFPDVTTKEADDLMSQLIGARVKCAFSASPQGLITDFWFELVG